MRRSKRHLTASGRFASSTAGAIASADRQRIERKGIKEFFKLRNFFLPGRSPVYAAQAAVATSHPMSTLVALEVLRSGGNAPKGHTAPIALNGSGRAPAAAEAAWYRENKVAITQYSAHAVMVPGAIGAWAQLVSDYGTRSLGEALRPAIRLAEEGFVVQSRVAWDW
jgi:gamma-glutamyltranspeptidase/glutathione hydrolase